MSQTMLVGRRLVDSSAVSCLLSEVTLPVHGYFSSRRLALL